MRKKEGGVGTSSPKITKRVLRISCCILTSNSFSKTFCIQEKILVHSYFNTEFHKIFVFTFGRVTTFYKQSLSAIRVSLIVTDSFYSQFYEFSNLA